MQRKERIPLHDHSDGNSGGRIGSSGLQSAVVSTTTTTTSGGAANLSELGDVNVITTPPADNDSLTYDSASGKWIPEAVTATVAALDDVGDVNAPTPSDGDVLTWDSTPGEWVAAAPTGGSGAVATDAIWDAAGDLAVGTGANTAAKLAIGANTYVLTSNGTTATWAAPSGGASDYVSGASGTGHITIPGIAVPDRVPGSPNANDDEFTSYSGWSNLGSPTTAAVTNPSHLRLKKANVGLQIHGIYKTAPSVPYAALVKIDDYTSLKRGNYTSYGLAVGDSTPTAWCSFCFGTFQNAMTRDTWTNNTTRATTSTATNNGDLGSFPPYLLIAVNSSTSIDAYFSVGGLDSWIKNYSAVNPGFTPSKIGIVVQANGQDADMSVDYIRFWTGTAGQAFDPITKVWA